MNQVMVFWREKALRSTQGKSLSEQSREAANYRLQSVRFELNPCIFALKFLFCDFFGGMHMIGEISFNKQKL